MALSLSVIVPVYNSGAYLVQCVDSILDSDFKDLELILVDDGSTDSSPAIIDGYASRDSRVRVIHQENKGQMKATLAGLEKACGRFISMVDSDDFISSGMYTKMIDAMQDHGADLVTMPGLSFSGKRKKAFCDALLPGSYDRSAIESYILPNLFSNHSLYGNRGMQSQKGLKLFKRELFLSVYESVPTDIEMGEDMLLSYTYIARCSKIVILDKSEYGYMYRNNTQSISWRYRKDLFNKSMKLCDQLRKLPGLECDAHHQGEVDYEVCFFAINSFLNEFLMKSERTNKQRIDECIRISKDAAFRSALSRINRNEVKQPNRILLATLGSSNRIMFWAIGSAIRLFRPLIIKIFLAM